MWTGGGGQVELSKVTDLAGRQDNPAWTMGMYSNWTATVDAFAKYENILTFSAGDQLLNSGQPSFPLCRRFYHKITIFLTRTWLQRKAHTRPRT